MPNGEVWMVDCNERIVCRDRHGTELKDGSLVRVLDEVTGETVIARCEGLAWEADDKRTFCVMERRQAGLVPSQRVFNVVMRATGDKQFAVDLAEIVDPSLDPDTPEAANAFILAHTHVWRKKLEEHYSTVFETMTVDGEEVPAFWTAARYFRPYHGDTKGNGNLNTCFLYRGVFYFANMFPPRDQMSLWINEHFKLPEIQRMTAFIDGAYYGPWLEQVQDETLRGVLSNLTEQWRKTW